MKSILLVEDDDNLAFLLSEHLKENGFKVKLCMDGEEGLSIFKNQKFDLCVLDVMLPKKDGFTLSKDIKSINPDIPIVLLTARDQSEDKIKGFHLGIDDYITKPFNEEELVLRIKAVLNRVYKNVESEYEIGQYIFSPSNQMLKLENNERRLTKKESDILLCLCQNPNTIVNRGGIMKQVWGEEDYFINRSLDVFISKLRKYLGEDKSVQITSVPSVGLILETE